MIAILSALPLLQSAISIFGQFKGTAAAAKVNSDVQDAVSVIDALVPLVTQFGGGVEVTPEDVRKALAGKDAALKAFDAEIAAKGG